MESYEQEVQVFSYLGVCLLKANKHHLSSFSFFVLGLIWGLHYTMEVM